MNSPKIAPSIMCANFKCLRNDIDALNEAKCEYLHFDIMDGTFVPNFTLGPNVMHHVREMSNIPFDIHLMVMRPEEHLHRFDIKENDYVSFHAEACFHIERTLKTINDTYGAKSMLALNPATPLNVIDYVIDSLDAILLMTVNPGYAGQNLIPSTLNKIADLRRLLAERGRDDIEIEVDGNVSFENAKLMRKRGADIFVAGSSSVFDKNYNITEATEKLRECIS